MENTLPVVEVRRIDLEKSDDVEGYPICLHCKELIKFRK